MTVTSLPEIDLLLPKWQHSVYDRTMLEPETFTRFSRQILALSDQVGTDDPEAFAQLVALSELLEAGVIVAAQKLTAGDYSWADLARPLGIRRETAYKRYSTKTRTD